MDFLFCPITRVGSHRASWGFVELCAWWCQARFQPSLPDCAAIMAPSYPSDEASVFRDTTEEEICSGKASSPWVGWEGPIEMCCIM